MPRLVHDLPVTLGMSLEDTRAALAGARIPFEVCERGDAFSMNAYVDFAHDDVIYSVRIDQMYSDSVMRIDAEEKVRDLEDGVALVERHIERHGAPVELRQFTTARTRHECLEWLWEDFGVALRRAGDGSWRAHIGSAWNVGPSGADQLSLDEVRAIAAEVRACLDAARPGDGERGAAVAQWVEIVRWRSSVLDRFVKAIAATAPETPISSVTGRWLAEHAGWLGRHHELFDQVDDWRDGLVVIRRERLGDLNEGAELGWEVDHAHDDECDREVLLVRGPFATGVHRVVRPADELYALHGDLSIEDVTVTSLPKEESLKSTADRVEASSGATTVRLSGYSEGLTRLARTLAVLRRR
ncbi:MAG: hypothetical protein H0T79_19665 [Deltaproteobacteria bacterium]|nr:hypothetical protein [Deltaproteobacteria bacterium]